MPCLGQSEKVLLDDVLWRTRSELVFTRLKAVFLKRFCLECCACTHHFLLIFLDCCHDAMYVCTSQARNFRKSSTIHQALPKEGDLNNLKGLKRTMSGTMEGSHRQKRVAQTGRNSSNSIKSGGTMNFGNVRDLDGFNDQDSNRRDSDVLRTPADQNGSDSEPQEPPPFSRSTITAACASTSSQEPGSTISPPSGVDGLLVHPSPAGRHNKGASSNRRRSLMDALRAINPGARLWKVLPVGVNGGAVDGPAALKANVSESRGSAAATCYSIEGNTTCVFIPILCPLFAFCWLLRGKGETQSSVVIVAAPARPHVRWRVVRGDRGRGGRGGVEQALKKKTHNFHDFPSG